MDRGQKMEKRGTKKVVERHTKDGDGWIAIDLTFENPDKKTMKPKKGNGNKNARMEMREEQSLLLSLEWKGVF
jgi:hypothetical protein